MNNQNISKYLSYILRHCPQDADLTLDANGWVDIDLLIENTNKKKSLDLTYEIIEEVVATNDKKRFSISIDGQKIRANQGHSINIDLDLQEKIPPVILYHGTATRFIDSIKQSGIKAMNRQFVHLSLDKFTAEIVGKRHGKVIILEIKSLEMFNEGQIFYISENGVWLTKQVDTKFIVF